MRDGLVGEGGAHHKARVASCAAEVHEASFGQQDDLFSIGEFNLIDLRLDVCPFQVAQRLNLDFIVKVADIADDCAVFHVTHMVNGDDVFVARGGYEDIRFWCGAFHGYDLIAFHCGLQRADGVDLGDHHAATGLTQAFGGAFAYIAKASDHSNFTSHHHIGGAADCVDEALAAAIFIVEF